MRSPLGVARPADDKEAKLRLRTRRITISVIGNCDMGVKVNPGKTRDEPAITVGDRGKCSLAFPESIEKTKVWRSGVTDDCLDCVLISLGSPNGQNSQSDDGLDGDSPLLRSANSTGVRVVARSLAPTQSPLEAPLGLEMASLGEKPSSETAGQTFT
jgi:hypothetical protein